MAHNPAVSFRGDSTRAGLKRKKEETSEQAHQNVKRWRDNNLQAHRASPRSRMGTYIEDSDEDEDDDIAYLNANSNNSNYNKESGSNDNSNLSFGFNDNYNDNSNNNNNSTNNENENENKKENDDGAFDVLLYELAKLEVTKDEDHSICPICAKKFEMSVFAAHVYSCLDAMDAKDLQDIEKQVLDDKEYARRLAEQVTSRQEMIKQTNKSINR